MDAKVRARSAELRAASAPVLLLFGTRDGCGAGVAPECLDVSWFARCCDAGLGAEAIEEPDNPVVAAGGVDAGNAHTPSDMGIEDDRVERFCAPRARHA
jgi:hypothetical protein